jgi:hypothetical protein
MASFGALRHECNAYCALIVPTTSALLTSAQPTELPNPEWQIGPLVR